MAIAIAGGHLGGILLAIHVSKWILQRATNRFPSDNEHKKWIRILGIGFGAASLVPAIFLSTVVGGSLGGGYGGIVSEAIGLGGFGVPIGLAIGLMLVTVATVAVATVVGAIIGSIVTSVFDGESAT